MIYEIFYADKNELKDKINFMASTGWKVHTCSKLENSDQFFVLLEKSNKRSDNPAWNM
jgi:hypothetical protein